MPPRLSMTGLFRSVCLSSALAVLAPLSAMLAPVQAHAAEIVTLRTGFTITCTSREPISAETVRLHLRSGDAVHSSDADNYMDVAATAIATVEAAPDEPALPAPKGTHTADTATILAASGARHNLNVALLAAVVKAESGDNIRAVSRTGAQGLMQLMPATAASLGVHDSFSAESNVNGGSTYLDQLLTRYHESLPLALAAYNAGPAAVDRYHGIPPYRETQAYVARVIREFNRRVAAASR